MQLSDHANLSIDQHGLGMAYPLPWQGRASSMCVVASCWSFKRWAIWWSLDDLPVIGQHVGLAGEPGDKTLVRCLHADPRKRAESLMLKRNIVGK